MYAGLRAATEHADYVIRAHPTSATSRVGGIRSTGLTASMAIAEHVAALLRRRRAARSGPRRDEPPPSMPALGERQDRPYQRADLVARDPAYGAMVCHCERVSRGELRDALASARAGAHAGRAAPADARD